MMDKLFVYKVVIYHHEKLFIGLRITRPQAFGLEPKIICTERVEISPFAVNWNFWGVIQFISAAPDQSVTCHKPAEHRPVFP